MLKKILIFVLTAAMLMTSLLIPSVSAATTEKVDGVTYTAVQTEQELAEALKKGGKILLKNDIELTDAYFASDITIPAATILEGAGHTLTAAKERSKGVFTFASALRTGQSYTEIRNLNFGSAEAPILLKDKASLFSEKEAMRSMVNFRNVNFYLEGTGTIEKKGLVFTTAKGVTNFSGCTLHAKVSGAGGTGYVGGWIGEISGGEVTFTDCVAMGTLEGLGSLSGFVGTIISEGRCSFTDCINLTNVTGDTYVAGFVANAGVDATMLYFTDCVNYGAITATKTDYTGMASGFAARLTNPADESGKALRVFYRCVNYGAIRSGSSAGGFVGRTNDYDSANSIYYKLVDCINFGSINGAAYAGGIAGVISPATFKAELVNCINVGKITSAEGYAGNFAGMLCKATVKGGWAAGVVNAPADKRGALVAHTSGNYEMKSGPEQGKQRSITAPTVSGVTLVDMGSNFTGTMEGVTVVNTDAALKKALPALSEACGTQLVIPDDFSLAYVVSAEPMLRGVQKAARVYNGVFELRFAASINAIKPYSVFGFDVAITRDGVTETETIETYRLYETLYAGEGSVAAEDLSVRYLFAKSAKNIPTTGRVVIRVTPYAKSVDGTATYLGKTKLLTLIDGDIVSESMMLNGMMLDEYAIVYANSNKNCENFLADRLADQIKQMTGATVPVFSSIKTHNKAAEIVIGEVYEETAAMEGRVLCQKGDSASILISGDTVAQLSESVTYFLELMEEKLDAGDNVMEIKGSVEVPVDTKISMMAYNTGAQDNALAKLSEWGLISNYLPDILTMQEPYASWLDDFLNSYAVQPEVKFKAASRDVMSVVYNGTGDGYYGVYWGEPRFKAGDACVNGAASYSVILYARDRFTVDESKSGTFWLSATPDVSGSIFSGSDYTRCATYATLTDINTGEQFVVVNVHLDFVTETQKKQINVLLRVLKDRVGTDLPIIVSGDMNARATSDAIKLYKKNDYMKMYALDELAYESYRNKSNIDWFFTNMPTTVNVSYYKYCGEQVFHNNVWLKNMGMGMPSDHPAIYTEFTIQK